MFCLFPLHDRKHVNDVNGSKNILSPCGYNLKDWDRHRIRIENEREREREERERVKQERENSNTEWKGSREGIGKRIKSKTRISFTYEQLPFAYQ